MVVADRRTSHKHKTNTLTSCVTLAYMCGQETMTLAETQQEKVQVCKKNCCGKKKNGN